MKLLRDQTQKWTGRVAVRLLILTVAFLAISSFTSLLAADNAAGEGYRSLPAPVDKWIDNRTAVWMAMQLHLMFAAFVLAVPIFALIVEVVGMSTGDDRYDKLAKEFVKLLSAAFSTTAAFGGLAAFLLIGLYPRFTQHWSGIFHKSFYIYGLLFFGEAFSLYLYYYSWERLKGAAKSKLIGALCSMLLWISLLLFMLLICVSMVYPRWVDSMMANPRSWGLGLLAVYVVGQIAIWSLTASKNFGTPRMAHLGLGLLLNFFGTFLMVLANSWATHMMAPSGVSPLGELNTSLWNPETKEWLGSIWKAIHNPLWKPVNVHRLIANVTFGGFIVGAYAAIRFLTTQKEEQKAHYDWMGYLGNFIGIAAFIPLPFAGYYLGREIYGANPSMGLLMMGGGFSWAFIIQAILIGIIFIGANYYLWMGMGRVEGDDPYARYIKFILCVLFLGFAVWLTPHNLPLSGEERALIGAQYHMFSSWFGVMVAKNSAVQFMILATFYSFLLYQRRSKGDPVPFKEQGVPGYVTVSVVGVICILFLGNNFKSLEHESLAGKLKIPAEGKYTFHVSDNHGAHLSINGHALRTGEIMSLKAKTHDVRLDYWKLGGGGQVTLDWEAEGMGRQELTKEALGLSGEKTETETGYLRHLQILLGMQIAAIVIAAVLTFLSHGKLGQVLMFAVTIYSTVIHLSVVIGYDIMAKANPLLRVVSVTQVLLVISCLIFVTFLDVFLFRKAKTMKIRWGSMPVRSQYVLILLCLTIVMLMGLMGFIRSGLRENWHVLYILRDTSKTAFTPTYAYMAKVVAIICFIFFSLVSFVFWLSSLGDKKAENEEAAPAIAEGDSES